MAVADDDQPNVSPFADQVHNERIIPPVDGLDQNTASGMRGKLIESILQLVVQAITGVFLPGPLGSAFTQLTDWAGGLFDMIREPLSALVNLLVTILDSIPIIGEPLGNAVEDLAALFGLMHTDTVAAQDTGNTANVGLTILTARVDGIVVGGTTYSDTFNRNGSDLGPDYVLDYSSGSGSVGTSTANAGTTVWTPSGFSDRSYIGINTAFPMTQNKVRVSLVIDQFIYGFAGNQANAYLVARCDVGVDNCVIGVLGNLDVSGPGTAEVGYILAGVYHRIGSPVSITTGPGDLWDLVVGDGDDYQIQLFQNNSMKVDENDSSHLSHMDVVPGTTYKYTGLGEDCYIGAGPFGSTYQGAPPNIQVLAGADIV